MDLLKVLNLIFIFLLIYCQPPVASNPCEPGSETFNLFAISRVATNDSTPYCNISFSRGRSSSTTSPTTNPSPNSNSLSEIDVLDETTRISSGFTKTYPSIISSGTLASRKTFNFTIRNTGSGVLNISSINISGSSFFTLSSTPVTSIPANSESIISVRYEPTANGAHTATLTINSDSRTNPSFTISLTGSGFTFSQASFLQVYYRFNNNLDDSTSNNRHGTPVGILTYLTDRFGNPNGAVTGSGNPANRITFTTSNFNGASGSTFAFWVRISNDGVLLGRGGSSGQLEMSLHYVSSVIFGRYGKNATGWDLNGGTLGVGGQNLSSGPRFYHIVFVRNGITTILYVDGVQVATNPDTNNGMTTATNIPQPITLLEGGGTSFAGGFNGAMDSFMHFNVAFTAAQVQQLFEQDLD